MQELYWTEAVATACFTQNRSIIRLCHNKTPYELLHNKLLDVSYFHVFGALYYPTNDSENLEKLQPKADIVSTRLQPHEQALVYYYDAFLTSVEPKTYKDALTQSCWIEAMKEKLNEFKCLENMARLVARRCRQEELINFEESFALVARLEAIRIFLAFAAHMNMVVYQMDVNTAFLNGSVDTTLFIRRNENDLLLVQIYVDDIIFAASTPELCDLFAKNMCSKFKMSMMGKISFFLGLPISQSLRCIVINQSIYALESLKKYGFKSCDPIDTPMVEKSKLDEDKEGKAVDPTHYRGMIGTLLYITASRPDLQFAICMCARSKHIDIRYHFIKAHIENGVIELYFVNTKYQLADIFTKALGRERIKFLINKLGMRSFTPGILQQVTDEVDE
nr:hypothetical protein [Tanacetum cinerariifolium]